MVVPKAYDEAMREVARKLAVDSDYAADAMKTVGFVPDDDAGDKIQCEVVNALTITSEEKEFIAKCIARGRSDRSSLVKSPEIRSFQLPMFTFVLFCP